MIQVQLPQLYAKQFDAFFNDAELSITEATTKGGKTVGALVWQAKKVLDDTLGLNHWWVAPFHFQANIAYSRAKRMLTMSSGETVFARSHDSDKWLLFHNGAKWWFKAAEKPDTLYGEDVGSAVCDEFTRMREEAFHAVQSTVTATEGQIRMIGNVKGRQWGYHLARRAESGARGMLYTRITADDAVRAGVLSEASIQRAREILPSRVFRELYYCEPDDDAGNPFGMAAIERCLSGRSTKPTAVFGIDLARSVDYTVVTGLDAGGIWTEAHRFQCDWGETKRRLIEIIGDRPALVDDTGVGSPIVEELQRSLPRVEGFTFTSQSKQHLMEGLQSAIHQKNVGVPSGPGYESWADELRIFEYHQTRTGVKYAAPDVDGLHDDCVCSLALAVRALGQRPLSVNRVELIRTPVSGWLAGEAGEYGSALMGAR